MFCTSNRKTFHAGMDHHVAGNTGEGGLHNETRGEHNNWRQKGCDIIFPTNDSRTYIPPPYTLLHCYYCGGDFTKKVAYTPTKTSAQTGVPPVHNFPPPQQKIFFDRIGTLKFLRLQTDAVSRNESLDIRENAICWKSTTNGANKHSPPPPPPVSLTKKGNMVYC